MDLFAVGAEYVDFSLDPVNGTVALTRQLQDNEFIQPVTLIAKVRVNYTSVMRIIAIEEFHWRLMGYCEGVLLSFSGRLNEAC